MCALLAWRSAPAICRHGWALYRSYFFFFFSSRRRHTRCSRDWSSDVCSSDLTAAGTPVERAANTNAHVQLNNRWWVHGGATAGQVGTTFCDRNCSRGGPAVRNDPYLSAWSEVDGDARPALVPYMWFNYFRGDGGRSERFNGNTQITFRVASQFKTSVTLSATHNVNDIQPHGTDSTGTHYTFAHLNQKTVLLTGRVDYTLSTVLTLQLYAQPFVSKGTYSNLRSEEHTSELQSRLHLVCRLLLEK